MPVKNGRDSLGPYYQWGTQKKYYYKPNDDKSRNRAKEKATKQGIAIHASGWKGR